MTTQQIPDTIALEVNKLARRNRHLKIFSAGGLIKTYFTQLLSLGTTLTKNVGSLVGSIGITRIFGLSAFSPQKRLFLQSSIIGVGAILLSSFTPGATFTASSQTYSYDYISEYYFAGDIIVDEEGYVVKSNPQTGNSNRIGLTDYAVHTVESGETLSAVASHYGLSVNTIMWENGLANANSLRIGQKLLIPPVDGVSYEVKSGDNLQKIADKYKVSSESIIAQNNLENETILQGQNLFLPGAKPIEVPSAIAYGSSRTSSASRSARSYDDSSATPAVGRIFIFPTNGSITQGYKSGHYAIDIADSSMPPVWAAGAGTVTKVSTGTWGGGYGNHVVIDHGNGMQTLYAHLDSVSVSEGDWVDQGTVIGVMGNTGRVYGITGIHLHWEVIYNGVKQYPGDYY